MRIELLTVGHGAQAAADLAELLAGAEIASVVDVRISPSSRKHPQFARAQLQQWLPAAGIGYRWEQRLGGHRRLPKDSPDVALRNASFRAYAAHMRTTEFTTALSELMAESAQQRTAIMCSETVWWRCHRRMVADHLMLLDAVTPLHLMPGGRQSEHHPTSGVRVGDGVLVYDHMPSSDSEDGSA